MEDPTFAFRACAGVGALLVWGTWDFATKGSLKRLREYAFLFGVTLLTVVYALLHDALTFSLSYDYFALGKGLIAPSFWPDVAFLAAQAGWTAGLVIGLVLLVVNNPSPVRAQLTYRTLVRTLAGPLVGALTCAVLGALSASLWTDSLLMSLGVERFESAEPEAFVHVWCIHIGSYVGAALGLTVSCISVWRRRTRLCSRSEPALSKR
ncbi:MAG: hypothetical protein AAF645_01120 [Myxococcota bacterium]